MDELAVEKHVGQVDEQVQRLAGALATAEEILGIWRERLARLMRDPEPFVEEPQTEKNTLVPFASDLNVHVRKLIAINNEYTGILGRLEV